jgi:predicted ATPase
MKIVSLAIENFRVINRLRLDDLSNAIVIAGPNGCGKSTVFDAIRLLKSAYGQYHENEWQSFFNEFQIDVKELSRDARRFLFDQTRDLVISAEFSLEKSEREYLQTYGSELLHQAAWQRILKPVRTGPFDLRTVSPIEKRQFKKPIERQTKRATVALVTALESATYHAQLRMTPAGEITVTDSPVLEGVFALYAPTDIGVIDYHSSNRHYGRERVGSVNLSVEKRKNESGQHALYNTQNKYTNIKTEMASAYVQELIRKEAGAPINAENGLIESLKELFEVFFPDKKFLGPQPTIDGSLLFHVKTAGGQNHDIDELSSGEKEVLLGYLRLRNRAPRNSLILIDEPELHLNPRLVRGLPAFYAKHLGRAYNNQIWMVTHSDTLLREAVEEPGFKVYHMQPPYRGGQVENQAILLNATAEIERALIDLVGDLASYSPRSKVVILEGGGDSEVDKRILEQLFPEIADQINLVSGGSNVEVRRLQELLESAGVEGRLRARFYSIVDRDLDRAPILPESQKRWDRYHIENYLLEPRFISLAIQNLSLSRIAPNEHEIEQSLQQCAQDTMNDLIRIEIEQFINSTLRKSFTLNVNRKSAEIVKEFRIAADRAISRTANALDSELSLEELTRMETELRARLHRSLTDGTWLQEFRGRDILKRFTQHESLRGVGYEQLRNLIVNGMRQQGFQPIGMKRVLQSIIEA